MRCPHSLPRLFLCALTVLGATQTHAFAQVSLPDPLPMPAPSLARRIGALPFDAVSLAGWTVDARASRPPAVAGGVISLDEAAGWLRTKQTEFGTFTLRFSARVSSPASRAIVALLGEDTRRSESAFAVLLSGDFPDPRRWPSANLNAYIPDERARREAWSEDDWQRFELTRLPERVVMRLNDRVILNIDSPVTLDGWLGFRVQGGTLELRDVTLATRRPSLRRPLFDRDLASPCPFSRRR